MATDGRGIIGINSNGIEKIKTAMEDYRKDVYSHNVISASNAKLNAAFKGTTVESQVTRLARQVMNDIDNSMKAIMSDFESRISNVEANYKKQDSSSTVISNAINSIKS